MEDGSAAEGSVRAPRAVPGHGGTGPDHGDADTAVEQLYATHWRGLVRLSVLLVGDQAVAEEVVQDAFVALHQRWHRLAEQDRALAYLRQSVVNRSRSVLRRGRVADRHLARERSEVRAGPGHDPIETAERRDAVLAALRRLPRRQREVLVLRYYADLSEAEIADTLGTGRGAVKRHASRGAQALRQLLPQTLLEER